MAEFWNQRNGEFSRDTLRWQKMLTVSSNSTVSHLNFDSANKRVSFDISGPAGTVGYAGVYIPKSIASKVTASTVYLDLSKVDYEIKPQEDSWLLSFSYIHNTHQVIINLQPQTTQGISVQTLIIVVPVVVAATAFAVSLFVLKRTRKTPKPAKQKPVPVEP